MMDAELPVYWADTRDESTFERDGRLVRVRKYTFHLGKFGPFVERVPLDPFDEHAIGNYIDRLRATLRAQQQL